MIFRSIKETLESVSALEGNVYPTAVVIDSIKSRTFAIYYFKKRNAVRAMNGRLVYQNDEVNVELYAKDYDAVHELYTKCSVALLALRKQTVNDCYIMAINVRSEEEEGADLDHNIQALRMTVQLRWCPAAT